MSRDISPGEPLPAELEVYPPPIGRLLFSRGIETAAEAERFFSPDYERDLFSPESLPDMPAAVDRLRTALAAGEKVGIHGDYDADGVCAAALLADALSDLGFAIEVFIPHKEEDGHGLSSRAVEEFAAAGIKLIVTVDCGSSSREEVERARRKGMEVIITDHHLVPPERPRALLVNPKVDPGKYPNPELCGAGVALKLAQALYGRLRPEKSEQTKWLLDLAALATVADMVPLRGENRTLTVYGLLVMSKTRRVGLRALIASALSETDRISAEDVAFSLAPRINAAGRMDHAREAFDLLVEKDASRARERANNLRKLNDRRRSLSEKVIAMAKEQLSALESLPAGVVIGHKEYFHGVVGLAAGKLAEQFARPVGVFHCRGEIYLGSFRSGGGADILEILSGCADCLVKFGGHRSAAGATVRAEKFTEFAERFARLSEEICSSSPARTVPEAEIGPGTDWPAVLSYLKKFAPFGQGNPEPRFLFRDLRAVSARTVGKDSSHLKVTFKPADGIFLEGIGFGLAERVDRCLSGEKITLVGKLRENRFGGSSKQEIFIEEIC